MEKKQNDRFEKNNKPDARDSLKIYEEFKSNEE